MKVLLRLACLIALLISSLEADKCKHHEEVVSLVSSAYEIDIRSCSPVLTKNNITVIWYQNDSTTPVSTERNSRIHQYKDKLWFVPAKVEDSGHFYCIVRNSTYCLKSKLTTKFVKNEPDSCYNAEAVFPQKLPTGRDGTIVCPYMDLFKDENDEFPQIQWYKNCKPLLLDNVNFIEERNKLLIRNANEAHRGNYTCHATYTHLGKQYPITRTILFTTVEGSRPRRPVIMSPANETLAVALGSQLQLICNVTGHLTDVYWKWNKSFIPEDDPMLVEAFSQINNPLDKKNSTIIAELNISAVESKFYLHPFICFAKNTQGMDTAYIQLVHPVPDFQKHTIGILVMLTVVITSSVFIYKIFKVDIVLWYRDSCYDFLSPKASDGKTYDAYILYPKTLGEGSTSDSDIFVFKILPEVLEKQCGYKLFIYGRDDDVGEDIMEVTNENIKKSRRLIIILVRGALGFSWLASSSEEQIAMYNALIQDGIKVVLLELEKIQDDEKMPESIKYIKRKQGAICWSGDVRAESQSAKTRFWKNVRYHLPARQQPSSIKQQLLSPGTRPNSKEELHSQVPVPLG
ncbi:PREDICTED: interleukin-1 receptor type 1 [Condylura cristata]|uniref:interleukin-1 receptor type 1 n=1 Tax=Condylura cristata TaxID=143302 RepID=UPI0003347646|nr:PREDICTED: interleukin-1 receptor type 1 [Condylura cristata]XP_012582757.1 PREDICTED: interleukin-1 receptor type 1 [Condylura cristata]